VVTEYLGKAGLLPYLEKLGSTSPAYGAPRASAIPAAAQPIEEAIVKNDMVCAAVLSGNRQFEARIHPNIRATSSPRRRWWWRYALAGSVLVDFKTQPLGKGTDRERRVHRPHLADPGRKIAALMKLAMDPATFAPPLLEPGRDQSVVEEDLRARRAGVQLAEVDLHRRAAVLSRFLDGARQPGDISGAKILGNLRRLGDHRPHLPAGSIKPTSPAGIYLQEHDVAVADFNSYGARRGNHEVMMRGTFANVRIKNLMLPAPKAE